MTHSNPVMVASVVENATTNMVAGVKARVTETEELAAVATATAEASGSAAVPAGEVVSA